MPDIPNLQPYMQSALDWLLAHVLTVEAGVQLAAVLVTLCIALLLRGQVKAGVARMQTIARGGFLLRRLGALPLSIYVVLVWLMLLYLVLLVTTAAGGSHRLITIAVSLQTAWVIIRLTSGLLRNPLASRTMASVAWALAALNIIGLLDPTLAMLEGVSASFGDFRISALAALKALAVGAFLLWAALAASRFVELQISRSVSLTPSIQVLTSKLIKIVLITLAIVVALSGVGIDLTAFAVFSGAVEHLIPNENLITQNVINWSYSSRKVRLRAPLGVSYDTDLPHALKVCMEAAGSLDRVLNNPAPNCLITGFGDSSIDLELRFWVEDPEAGAGNIKSADSLVVTRLRWRDRHRLTGSSQDNPQYQSASQRTGLRRQTGRAGPLTDKVRSGRRISPAVLLLSGNSLAHPSESR